MNHGHFICKLLYFHIASVAMFISYMTFLTPILPVGSIKVSNREIGVALAMLVLNDVGVSNYAVVIYTKG